jgi:glycine cleavage system aminomethyltransferase T
LFLRPYEFNGMRVVVSRTGYTAELGYEIYLYEASRNGERPWDAVLEAGRPHGIAVIGPSHIRRIEGASSPVAPICCATRTRYKGRHGLRLDGRPRAGTELEIDTPHGRAAAVVVEKPFIDPKKKISKRALGAALGGGSGSAADG